MDDRAPGNSLAVAEEVVVHPYSGLECPVAFEVDAAAAAVDPVSSDSEIGRRTEVLSDLNRCVVGTVQVVTGDLDAPPLLHLNDVVVGSPTTVGGI